MAVTYSNNAFSTLASGYTAGASTITLQTGDGALFPSSGDFMCAIANPVEFYLNCTSRSGDVLTVSTTGQEGTTATNQSSGTAVAQVITAGNLTDLLAAATAGGYFPDILAESKPGGTMNSAKVEGATNTASSTTTLLSITPGSAGYVCAFFLAFTCSDSAARNSSTLTITVDGESTGGTFNDRHVLYFGSEYGYNTTNYANRWMGSQQNNSNNVGYYSFLPIPFNTSVVITMTNGSASTSQTVWANFIYQTGVTNTWPNTRKLRTASGTLTNQTVNTVETFVNATSLNPGRMFGLYMSLDAFPNTANPATAALEGNVKFYLDGAGSPTFESPGTEDYFLWSNYFEGMSTVYSSSGTSGSLSYDQGYTGIQFSSTSSPQTWNAYRYHIMDQVLFQNALKVTWNCGDSSQVNFTGGMRVSFCIWYYTE